jgi:glycosyltransferase involved in cell wall biosynthesis
LNILVIHEVSYDSKLVYEYQDFAERLAGRGHRVFVIDFDESGKDIKPARMVSRTGLSEVEVHSTPCINLPLVRFASARHLFPRFLRRFITEHNIDVIWLYSVFINGSNALTVAQALKVPVVYRIIDVYHAIRQNHIIRWPLYFLEKNIYRNVTHVSASNNQLAKYAAKMATVDIGNKTTILQHGVDIDFFQPTEIDIDLRNEIQLKQSERVVMFIGTLYNFSGLDRFLMSFARRRLDYINVRVVIVGDGPQRDHLEQIIQNEKLEDMVTMVGRRPYEEIPRWLSLADVTILPFELNEITTDIIPIKTLQYLSSGKPLVAAPIPDLMKLMPSTECGVAYADIGESDSFVDMALEIATDRPRSKSLGLKAREFATRELSVENTIDNLNKLLEQIAKETR